jgi:uncharacterized protein
VDKSCSLPPVLEQGIALQKIPLADDFHLVFCPSGSGTGNGIAVLNDAALEILSAFKSPRPTSSIPSKWHQWNRDLVTRLVIDMVRLGLLVSPNHVRTIPDDTNDLLSAWLHLTDRCNLYCDYCYLLRGKSDMSRRTARAAIDATVRSANINSYRSVKFKYAGGEPLLCFPLMLDSHLYAKSMADHNGLDVDGIVLTNGTCLTVEMAKRMQKVGLRLMVSLDGWRDSHNCQRRYPDGNETFDDVLRGIDSALTAGLIPEISITVSNRNAKRLSELVAWILQAGLPFSFNFYRESFLSASEVDLQLQDETIIEGLTDAYRIIENNLPDRSLLAVLLDRANLAIPHSRACTAMRDYLVFDTAGRVAKCQMELENPVTSHEDFDPLATIRASKSGLRNPRVDVKDNCRSCPWRYWCGGGCPIQAYRTTGTYKGRSPNCNIYKALYPQVVRLEGLRILKYAELE